MPTTDPKTLEQFVGSFDLPKQMDIRAALQKIIDQIDTWHPEGRGDKILATFLMLQRGIGAALDE